MAHGSHSVVVPNVLDYIGSRDFSIVRPAPPGFVGDVKQLSSGLF
jgi:hypothetical protein